MLLTRKSEGRAEARNPLSRAMSSLAAKTVDDHDLARVIALAEAPHLGRRDDARGVAPGRRQGDAGDRRQGERRQAGADTEHLAGRLQQGVFQW